MDEPCSKNMLVLHAGALGDCVLTLHVIQAVRRTAPGSVITLAARSGIARWAAVRGLVDHACSPEAIGISHLFHDSADARANGGRLRRFGRIVSFLGGREEPCSRRLMELSGENVIAVDPRPMPATVHNGVHISRQWTDAISAQGFPISADEPAVVNFSPDERASLRARLTERLGLDSPAVILCHPGAGSLSKMCPLEVLKSLMGKLRGRDRPVAWMIGPDERERFGPAYGDGLRRSAPVLSEESLKKAADLVAGAEAFIGNDAGMTHVAALAGVRTFALFGPTDPRVWKPLGRDVETAVFPQTPNGRDWPEKLRTRVERATARRHAGAAGRS